MNTSWRRSSFCWSGECVEVATSDGEVLVRNSTLPQTLQRYTTDEWRSFVSAVKSGEMDDLRPETWLALRAPS